jgi:hypothetical protein
MFAARCFVRFYSAGVVTPELNLQVFELQALKSENDLRNVQIITSKIIIYLTINKKKKWAAAVAIRNCDEKICQ